MTETTKDFYTDAQRRARITRIMLIIVGIGIALGVVSLMVLEKKKKDVAIAASTASAQAWKLAGPPCPTATTAEFAHHAERAKKVFDFNGDVYARRGGHVDCNLTAVKGVKDPVPVCQFTSPQAISVTIREINDISGAIATAVREQDAATREIAVHVDQVAQGSRSVNANIMGVTRSSGDVDAAAAKLLDAATGLSSQSERLRTEINGFVRTIRVA